VDDMVTIGGVRYQRGDAERRGLIGKRKALKAGAKKAPSPANKKRGVGTLSTKASVAEPKDLPLDEAQTEDNEE